MCSLFEIIFFFFLVYLLFIGESDFIVSILQIVNVGEFSRVCEVLFGHLEIF